MMNRAPTTDPHDLTVDFDKAKIDAALQLLGRQPWLSPRPRVIVFLAVHGRKDNFALVSDSDHDPDMRTALAAAADRVGLRMALPTQAQLALKGQSSEIQARDSDVALAGTLTWSDRALGWVADWRLNSLGKTYHWQIRGVGFDNAFRNGLRGAAQVLSGHGQPG
ncbi:DUF2066 domain-containing protein [Phyllobacterium zundukense]|uniref:DUF2066 domain-containing protein n=1 Tax=Phyllobacterium zundukense TaxID=1867719 RepID=A0A2N9VSP3_9HYPH|nr:DUF2066 domain-containing protein [Phyllobacterium zundukense]PIO42511.1 hypothetical protein B5P45_26280 [Phyllobacterium zundukense]